MMNKLIYIICGLIVAFSASAENIDALAQKAYNDQNYKEASSLYRDLIKTQGSSAQAYFNLGNAALKEGDYGQAVLAYERASRLAPSDSRISGNLEYALSKVADTNRMLLKGKQISVTPDSPSFFRSIYLLFAAKVSSNFWAWMAIVFFVIALLCVAGYLFLYQVALRKIGFFSAAVSLLLSIVFIVFSFAAAGYAGSKDQCVAKEYRFDLLSSPDADSKKVASTLSAGTLLDIIEQKKDADGNSWIKVRLNHQFIGWIPQETVEII